MSATVTATGANSALQSERQTTNPFAIVAIDSYEATLLNDAYQAITVANAWDFVRNFNDDGGFMFSRRPELNTIHSHMACMDDHSGSSYGITMRIMQRIGRIGLDAYLAERSAKN
jgi:hypothetical protein